MTMAEEERKSGDGELKYETQDFKVTEYFDEPVKTNYSKATDLMTLYLDWYIEHRALQSNGQDIKFELLDFVNFSAYLSEGAAPFHK